MNRMMLYIILTFLLAACSKTEPLDFWVNSDGRIFQLDLVKRKTLAWDEPVGLTVKDFHTGEELGSLFPKGEDVSPLSAYWLDSNRVVFNLLDDSHRRRKYHTGIWYLQAKTDRLYELTGSGAFGAESGIDSKESVVISCPYSGLDGIYVHDLKQGTNTQLLKDSIIRSPRFAPDGLRFAAFVAPRGQPDLLTIRTVGLSESVDTPLGKDRDRSATGHDLRWSPSGKYVAGIVWHQDISKLHIWDSNGKEISRLPLPEKPIQHEYSRMGYVPAWLPKDKGIIIFFQGKDGRIEQKKLTAQELGLP